MPFFFKVSGIILKLGNAFELHLLRQQWTHINMALIWSCYSPLLINKESMCDQSNGLSAPLNSWVNTFENLVSRARIRGEWARKLPGVPTYKGHKDVTGIIRNMVPINSGFCHEIVSYKIICSWVHTLNKFCQLCPRPKLLKNIGFKCHP